MPAPRHNRLTRHCLLLTLALARPWFEFSDTGQAWAVPGPKEEWLQATTAHFTLFSNAGEKKTRAIALGLERLQATLKNLFSPIRLQSPLPTRIFVFKGSNSFQPYRRWIRENSDNIAGVFLQTPESNFAAINIGLPNPLHSVYHEYLHFILANNLPGAPLWLHEGIAEYYGTFEADDDSVKLGKPIPEHVQWLREHAIIPIEELFAITTASKDYNEGSRQGVFYAESWALVHYLLFERPEGKKQLNQYIKAVSENPATAAAFEAAFGSTPHELTLELLRYARQSRFVYLKVSLPELAVDEAVQLQAMGRSQALAHLGELLLHISPDAAPEAERHFQEALAERPDFAAALAGMASLHALRGNVQEAESAYLKALELAPDDAELRLRHGQSLLDAELATGSLQASARLLQARAELQECLRLDPDQPLAQAALGKIEAHTNLEKPPSPEALPLLEAAARSLRFRVDVLFDLAMLHARLGHASRAEHLFEHDVAPRLEPERRRQGLEALRGFELLGAATLATNSKPELGVDILEKLWPDLPAQMLREARSALLPSIRRSLDQLLESKPDAELTPIWSDARERLRKLE